MTITALLQATGNASFQTNAPSMEEWDTAHMAHSRLVAFDGDPARHSQGIGKALLQALVTESEANGLWPHPPFWKRKQ
ncbi:GNAT family N-acetyltransferase [Dinghuibacter silviterrae]|uniref:hypothetical protein n=1 Tax=Dinghuibacter silviterrae TaxID=1539049 RepID=UPI0010632477|nr:hypothetical protein [Dinghuibacter silviterrae]